ncbi:transcriptional regulator ManR [Pullulanibacillus camelliae]|uniref:Transcriptional regulator ManR n=1 Tax=Pullulanibacillus camelliae TaxID=1707096 RepID=A0A8J2VHZ2_9BACL|nr:BglG family transcription antiterminator [Pullulanibacillus camelliae]GGE31219.1 transcriptional regulator ManR [Pullulanibacillus camelliae]
MNQRQEQTLELLLQKKQEPISIQEICTALECSEKTIRNDLKVLDHYIKEHAFAIALIRRRGQGVFVKGTAEEKQRLLLFLKRKDETVLSDQWLSYKIIETLILTNHFMRMQDLAAQCFTSRTKLANALGEIEAFIQRFDLTLERRQKIGIQIIGTEKNKRLALSKATESVYEGSDELSALTELIAPYEFLFIQNEIRQLASQSGIHFTDQSMISLVIHIAIAIKRIKLGQHIQLSIEEVKQLKRVSESHFASDLAQALEKVFVVTIPDTEVAYITIHLIGARLAYKKDVSTQARLNNSESYELATQLIERVSAATSISFLNDQDLVNGLMIHLQSTLNRLRYHLKLYNPLLADIKKMYGYMFDIILSESTRLIGLDVEMPEDEIGYLTLHFQAALERINKSQMQRVSSLIVCTTGTGTSQLLAAKCQASFPELDIKDTVSIYELRQAIQFYKPDLIISTVPIEKPSTEMLVVSPLLKEAEIKLIDQVIDKIRRKQRDPFVQSSMLKELIPKDLVFTQVNLEGPKAIIEFLSDQLYKKEAVSRHYKASALQREKLATTNIGNGVAIPHGEAKEIHYPTIAVAQLAQPTDWDGEPVQLVFMLATSALDKKQLSALFREISDLTDDLQRLNLLKQSTDHQTFYQHLVREGGH